MVRNKFIVSCHHLHLNSLPLLTFLIGFKGHCACPLQPVTFYYCKPPKLSPPSKICPPPFLSKVVAKGAFLSKVCPPIFASVHAVMLSKKYRRSSAVQEEGLTNKGRYNLLLLRKHAHDKRGIEESLHVQITRARLTACEVGIFSREISQLSKIRPPPTFRAT